MKSTSNPYENARLVCAAGRKIGTKEMLQRDSADAICAKCTVHHENDAFQRLSMPEKRHLLQVMNTAVGIKQTIM